MDVQHFVRSLVLLFFLLEVFFSVSLSRNVHLHNRHHRSLQHARRHNPDVLVGESYSDESGPWRPWSDPQECSRSCGGGVSIQTRKCLHVRHDRTHDCVGPSKKYFSCNIQDCPEGTADFRAEQCSKFDKIPIDGRYTTWIPYTDLPNKCELNCRPQGERVYYRHDLKVIDGTRCDRDTLDICVDGVCMPVGCDLILGSNATEDKCRECRGDGSTCKSVRGLIDLDNLHLGYNDILLIPTGATNIHIEETKATNNFLAIRNLTGHYYLNGNFRIDSQRDNIPIAIAIAGTTFHYARRPSKFQTPEALSALGPTTEPIYIMLLYQEKNQGIVYEYSVAKNERAVQADTYVWRHESFDECSRACGGGVQTRHVYCTRTNSEEVVDDFLCKSAIKPISNQTCNKHNCPAKWHVGGWEECSATCGGGVQPRIVFCQQIQSGDAPSVVNNNLCLKVAGPRPKHTRPCNTDVTCPDHQPEYLRDGPDSSSGEYMWMVTQWSKCSATCGGGVQTRASFCVQQDGENIKKVEDSNCDPSIKDETVRECTGKACEGVWLTGLWERCTAPCSGGSRTRKIVCWLGNKVGADSECDLAIKPDTKEPCNVESCDGGITSSTDKDATKTTGRDSTAEKGPTTPSSDCASSKFGCCEDQITSAEGPDYKGCPEPAFPINCAKTKFGCCPDGTTPARGPRNKGCACRESVYGCCSDGVTPATGDNYEGCSDCERTEFGCCADEKTPARGPNQEGCRCESSRWGCCPDGVTFARGKEQEGCECGNTRFGCCPDGVSAAGGPQYEGCEERPPTPGSMKAGVVCGLLEDIGSCSNFTVKWWFDIEYGGCARFWYGGCEGNDNRFDSQEECEEVCVIPEGMDACQLPKAPGPCETHTVTWYYDVPSGQCGQFYYGGCLGNNNRFATREECERTCAHTQIEDPCLLPKLEGPCDQNHASWYFDKDETMCKKFRYGGCKGNRNNFPTERDCIQQCASRNEKDPVTCPPDTFGCNDGECLNEHWKCDGDADCAGGEDEIQCPIATTSDPRVPRPTAGVCPSGQFLCSTGQCIKNRQRCDYVVDCPHGDDESSCQPCKADQWRCTDGSCIALSQFCNNDYDCPDFSDEDWCGDGPIVPTTPSVTPTTHTCTDLEWRCDDGHCINRSSRCNGYVECPADDSDEGNCSTHPECASHEFQCQDGKCIARDLQCDSHVDCPDGSDERNCQDCHLDKAYGRCNDSTLKWYYKKDTGVCEQFHYSGCNGNNNRFETRRECEQKCFHSQEICELPKVVGPCSGQFDQWYFNPQKDECEEFAFGGCLGNGNRFISLNDCRARCKRTTVESTSEQTAVGAEPCTLPRDAGPCQSTVHRWYFDGPERACKPFVFGGCAGNTNRFESEESCKRACGEFKGHDVCSLPNDRGPCVGEFPKWYHDPADKECKSFEYGGCSGNGNRFESKKECEQVCIARKFFRPARILIACKAYGYPRPKVTWWRGYIMLPSHNKKYEQFNNYSLLIRSVLKADYGNYSCQAYNGIGDPARWQVTVLDPNDPPRNGNLGGNPATNLAANESKEAYYFYEDDEPLEDAPVASEAREHGSVVLGRILDDAVERNGGKDAGFAHGDDGSSEKVVPFELANKFVDGMSVETVESPVSNDLGVEASFQDDSLVHDLTNQIELTSVPTFIDSYSKEDNLSLNTTTTHFDSVPVPVTAEIQLESTVFPMNSDIRIDCATNGSDSLKWFKDDAKLIPGPRVQVISNGTVIIYNAKASDTGTYKCEASNDFNSASSSASITINGFELHVNCTDNPYFSNCRLIVEANYCSNIYGARFCCKSCTLAGHLPVSGSH